MKDLERLRTLDADAAELLDAASAYRLSPGARRRILRAVLATGAGGSASAAWGLSVKPWPVVGAVAVALTVVTGGVMFYRSAPVTVNVAAPRAQPPRTIARVVDDAPAAAPLVAPPATVVVPVPPVQSKRPALSAPKAAPSPAPTAKELALLDAAQQALRGGDPAQALARLDDYQRTFVRGALRDEAWVLRIEALRASGDRPEARRQGQQFLRERPHSVLTVRVAAALRALANEEPAGDRHGKKALP